MARKDSKARRFGSPLIGAIKNLYFAMTANEIMDVLKSLL